MYAQEVKDKFLKDVEYWGDAHGIGEVVISRGAVIGVLEYACHGKENRYLVLRYLTGKTSSKDLTAGEWYALHGMVLPCKPLGGKWQSQDNDRLAAMVGAILAAVVDQPGQQRFEFDTPVPNRIGN